MDNRIRELYTDEEWKLYQIACFIGNMEIMMDYFNIDLKDLINAMSKSNFNIDSMIKYPHIFPTAWSPNELKKEFLDGGVDLEALPYYRQKVF